MREFEVFRRISGGDNLFRIYYSSTAGRIPETSGCYAWLLPLWIYRENLDELSNFVGTLLEYEDSPTASAAAIFNWQSVNLQVGRRGRVKITDDVRRRWTQALAKKETRAALERVLMEASLLMPPLYVGRAVNLRRRYREHVENRGGDSRTFHARFTSFATALTPKLGVDDLLFACIETPKEIREILDGIAADDPGLEKLVEPVLMQFCRPPFSLKAT